MRNGILLAALVLCFFSGRDASADVLKVCMGCNFAGAQLANSDFSAVVYIGSNFQGAVLTNASFHGARLVASNFEGANLAGAAFDGADCTACNFKGANLDGATFLGARMTAANFSGFASKVADAQLRALLAGCVACGFHSASFAGRDFSELPLVSVDFSQADLRNAKLNGAVLCWYVIDGAQRQTKCDPMPGANVTGASFLGVRLCTDPADPKTCTPVTGAALRRDSGSTLDGAILP